MSCLAGLSAGRKPCISSGEQYECEPITFPFHVASVFHA